MRCECGCECCSLPRAVERGGLSIQWDRITWHGRELTEPTPAQRRVLTALASRETASHRALEIAAGSLTKGDAAWETVANHLTRLRQWLVHNAVPLSIENIRGIGHRLVPAPIPSTNQPNDRS